MERFYWYKAELRSNFESFARAIKKCTFDDGIGQGFTVSSITENTLTGKYILSKYVTQEYINPFGENEIEERRVFEMIDFELINGPTILIETKNPGRCMKPFFNDLHKCSNYDLSVDTPSFNLPNVIAELNSKGLKFIDVKEIELTNLVLGAKATGSLIVKGSLSLEDYEKNLPLADIRHRLKKFKAIVDYKGIRDTLEVHTSSKIITSGKLAQLIIPLIRDTLYD